MNLKDKLKESITAFGDGLFSGPMSVIYEAVGNEEKSYEKFCGSKYWVPQHRGPKNFNEYLYQIGEGIIIIPTIFLDIMLN